MKSYYPIQIKFLITFLFFYSCKENKELEFYSGTNQTSVQTVLIKYIDSVMIYDGNNQILVFNGKDSDLNIDENEGDSIKVSVKGCFLTFQKDTSMTFALISERLKEIKGSFKLRTLISGKWNVTKNQTESEIFENSKSINFTNSGLIADKGNLQQKFSYNIYEEGTVNVLYTDYVESYFLSNRDTVDMSTIKKSLWLAKDNGEKLLLYKKKPVTTIIE